MASKLVYRSTRPPGYGEEGPISVGLGGASSYGYQTDPEQPSSLEGFAPKTPAFAMRGPTVTRSIRLGAGRSLLPGGSAGSKSTYQARYPTSSKTTSTVKPLLPDEPAPTLGEAPTFEAPKYDRRRIRALTQQIAAPQRMALERQVQQAVGGHYDNPNVKALMVRGALEAYGIGLAGALASAGRQATAEYGQEYQSTYEAAMANFRAKLDNIYKKWETQFNVWKSKIGSEQVGSTDTKYETGEQIAESSQSTSPMTKLTTYGYGGNRWTGRLPNEYSTYIPS